LSKDTLDTVAKSLQAIFFLVMIVITVYGQLSPYLNDFWKGFALGALVVFLAMLAFNIYFARRTKGETTVAPARITPVSTEPEPPVLSSKMETKALSQSTLAQPTRRLGRINGGQELLSNLIYFKTIWEQHGGSNMTTRWQPQYTHDMYTLSRSLLDLLAKHNKSWGFDLAHPVRLISDEMKGIASALQEGSDDAAIVHGDTAYGLVTNLLSFLKYANI
jgi:hypothetical protein